MSFNFKNKKSLHHEKISIPWLRLAVCGREPAAESAGLQHGQNGLVGEF
jgi:hypothetical protein